ncbi:hypothetical protein P9B40_18780 [Bacillus paralicheniformis]|uniref:hypothetical protein n=1 Tax=Bacillus paralicheniformis TaxID=1648923 RepID=UPI002DB8A94F|nr:hypothetical protein [Bacillus paralicheniformis]MEC1241398.1 hypothetical protein [Bacillus paralicheniformis]
MKKITLLAFVGIMVFGFIFMGTGKTAEAVSKTTSFTYHSGIGMQSLISIHLKII